MLISVGVIDVIVSVLVGGILIGLLGASELRVFVPLMIARALILGASLHAAATPIRDWQRRARFDERLLLAASDAVEAMVSRGTRAMVVGWIAAVGVALLLARMGVPPTGGPELLASVALLAAIALGFLGVLGPLLEHLLLDVRVELGVLRREHELGATRQSNSLARQLAVIIFALVASVLIGLSGTTAFERAKRIRAESLGEQRTRALVLATELHAVEDRGEIEPGILVVAFEGLPEQLVIDSGDPLGSSEHGTILGVIDKPRELAIAAAPVGDGRWVVVQAEVEQQLGSVALLLLGFVLSALFIAGSATKALQRVLAVPLAQLDEATRRVAEQGDLRSVGRIIPLRNDELGALANNFNRMLDMLDELTAAATAVASGDLRVEIRGTGDLPDALRGMLSRLNDVVEQIRSTSMELASAAAEIHAITREQEQATEQQSQRMLAVSNTIATLAQSADDISKTSTEVLDNAEQALSTTDAMIEKINLLSAQAVNVRALLELIHEVADRSDLLALNGALEATRAGEAGRAFALVALEMRRLAERVTGTVGDVRERIVDIEAAGASTVQATADSRRLAGSTATAARAISMVTYRQSEETEQVSHKVFEVAEGMMATVEAAKQTLSATEGLRLQAAELERLTRQFTLRTPAAAPGFSDGMNPGRASPDRGSHGRRG
jgi:methyl-accepting chemotaxis protein